MRNNTSNDLVDDKSSIRALVKRAVRADSWEQLDDWPQVRGKHCAAVSCWSSTFSFRGCWFRTASGAEICARLASRQCSDVDGSADLPMTTTWASIWAVVVGVVRFCPRRIEFENRFDWPAHNRIRCCSHGPSAASGWPKGPTELKWIRRLWELRWWPLSATNPCEMWPVKRR